MLPVTNIYIPIYLYIYLIFIKIKSYKISIKKLSKKSRFNKQLNFRQTTRRIKMLISHRYRHRHRRSTKAYNRHRRMTYRRRE